MKHQSIYIEHYLNTNYITAQEFFFIIYKQFQLMASILIRPFLFVNFFKLSSVHFFFKFVKLTSFPFNFSILWSCHPSIFFIFTILWNWHPSLFIFQFCEIVIRPFLFLIYYLYVYIYVTDIIPFVNCSVLNMYKFAVKLQKLKSHFFFKTMDIFMSIVNPVLNRAQQHIPHDTPKHMCKTVRYFYWI